MAKQVSVIIPTFNRLHTLRKVVHSYLRQEHLRELIFVIDGSNDGTSEFLETMTQSSPQIKIKYHEKNLGVSVSRNDGVDLATGDFILFGEDDVYLPENYVTTLLDCRERFGADVIAGRIVYCRNGESFEETAMRCDKYRGPLINYWLMSGFYLKKADNDVEMPFLHAVSLAKTDVCKRIKFDPSFFAREETDFYLRSIKEGYRVVFCPHTVCFHLPRDSGKGGGWRVGLLKYQYLATKNNNMLVDRHYALLKKWGMKGNKMTFKFLHLLNRIRIVYLYLRFSVKH